MGAYCGSLPHSLLNAELDSLTVDIAVVMETWFNKTVSDKCVTLPDYNIFSYDRLDGK